MADEETPELSQDYIDRIRGVVKQWETYDHHKHSPKLAVQTIPLIAKFALELADFAELLLCKECKGHIMPPLMQGQPYLCAPCGQKQQAAVDAAQQ